MSVLLKGVPAAPVCKLQLRLLRPVSIVYQCIEHFWLLFSFMQKTAGIAEIATKDTYNCGYFFYVYPVNHSNTDNTLH